MTELVYLCKKNKTGKYKKNKLLIGNYEIPNVFCVKYCNDYLAPCFSFQYELKHILREWAVALKTFNCIFC